MSRIPKFDQHMTPPKKGRTKIRHRIVALQPAPHKKWFDLVLRCSTGFHVRFVVCLMTFKISLKPFKNTPARPPKASQICPPNHQTNLPKMSPNLPQTSTNMFNV